MTKTLTSIIGVLLLVAAGPLTSCRSKKVGKEKLLGMIEHNRELCQEQEVNGIKVRLKYCPYQLLVEQEMQNDKKTDTAKLAALENKYRGQYYFRLSYSKDDKEAIRNLGSFHRYSDMLQMLSFELGKFINASTERYDTLYLKDYAFEQDFGMSTANTSMLVFDRNDFREANSIVVNIGEFGLGIGSMRFRFRKDALTGLPDLAYSKN